MAEKKEPAMDERKSNEENGTESRTRATPFHRAYCETESVLRDLQALLAGAEAVLDYNDPSSALYALQLLHLAREYAQTVEAAVTEMHALHHEKPEMEPPTSVIHS